MKLGDKDYWQVGDEVYSLIKGKGKIALIDNSKYPLGISSSLLDGYSWYDLKGRYNVIENHQTLFHIGAATFDEQGNLNGIDYTYVPDRTPKVKITKLPHEFVKGEEVMYTYYGNWRKGKFVDITKDEHTIKRGQLFRIDTMSKYGICTEGVCIPYKGNEHCEGKNTNCKSGRVPEGYIFPEKDPFSDVKVGDILYRLYRGKYYRGKVITVLYNGFTLETEKPTSSNDAFEAFVYRWEYDFRGEIIFLGTEQVIFKEIPKDAKTENTETVKIPYKDLKKYQMVWVETPRGWKTRMFKEYRFCKNCGGTIVTFAMRKNSIDFENEQEYNSCIPFEGNEHLANSNV